MNNSLDTLKQQLQANPDDAQGWARLAAANTRQQHYREADTCFQRSLQLQANIPDVWLAAARNAWLARHYQRCADYAIHAVRLAPHLPDAHLALGNARQALGANQEALTCYQAALALDPAMMEAHNNIGAVLLNSDLPEAAITAYRQALRLAPDNAQLHTNLGRALRRAGGFSAALVSFRQAINLAPSNAGYHRQLAHVLQDLGEYQQALASYRQAMDLQPDDVEAHSNMLYCLSHDENATPAEVAAAHRAFGRRVEAATPAIPAPHGNSPEPDRRLRLGFISADLRKHAVAHFIEPIWQALDRNQFEIIVYANQLQYDEVSQRLQQLTDQWLPVHHLDDMTLAGQIRNDRIDILFDLSGHTAGNRLLAFAHKPAPIQISWIGYPNTTGLTCIDYRLVDQFVAPVGLLDAQFTEKLAYLPSGGTFAAQADAPAISQLPALGNGYLTFGSFNRSNKLGHSTIALWSQVLNALPQARMLLGGINDLPRRQALIERFASHGIQPERLAFQPQLALQDYLASHHKVDILLDSLPFTSGTTVNHGLWMGVPTLTLAGPTMPQRLSAAHLARAGLTDWICESATGYIDTACYWATHLPQLAALRAGLRQQIETSPLRQPSVVTAGLQHALRQMWHDWCRQRTPTEP